MEMKWHCPCCLHQVDGLLREDTVYEAIRHLDVAGHDVDFVEMDDDEILALDDRLTHEITDMIADSEGGVPMDESHRELAKDILAKIDEVRGERRGD